MSLSFRRCGSSHEVRARGAPAGVHPGCRGAAGLGPWPPMGDGRGRQPDAAGPGVWGRPEHPRPRPGEE